MTNFIRKNLDVLGFHSEGNAFFQCIKELMDNAVDACRNSFIAENVNDFNIRCIISTNSELKEVEIEVTVCMYLFV